MVQQLLQRDNGLIANHRKRQHANQNDGCTPPWQNLHTREQLGVPIPFLHVRAQHGIESGAGVIWPSMAEHAAKAGCCDALLWWPSLSAPARSWQQGARRRAPARLHVVQHVSWSRGSTAAGCRWHRGVQFRLGSAQVPGRCSATGSCRGLTESRLVSAHGEHPGRRRAALAPSTRRWCSSAP